MPNLQHKRGTRSNLDALATASGLLAGQIYVITDEDRLAIATASNAYTAFLKEGEGGGVNSFYIWAEENGGIANNSYEWSYGNGATGNDIGVPIMVAANLTHISINADTVGTTATLVARRQLGSAGTGTGSVVATTSALNGTTNRVYTLPSPVAFAVGDMLIVQTGTLVGIWTDVRACFRFEEQ